MNQAQFQKKNHGHMKQSFWLFQFSIYGIQRVSYDDLKWYVKWQYDSKVQT